MKVATGPENDAPWVGLKVTGEPAVRLSISETVAVGLADPVAELTVSVTVTTNTKLPSSAYVWAPVTVKLPDPPVIVAVSVVPSPQAIVAVKSDAGLEVSVSVKVATGPEKALDSGIDTGTPVTTSGGDAPPAGDTATTDTAPAASSTTPAATLTIHARQRRLLPMLCRCMRDPLAPFGPAKRSRASDGHKANA